MKKWMFATLLVSVCGVQGAVVLNHDFSASGAPAFSSGELTGQNDWIGQNGWIVDSTGAGRVTCSLGGYLRIQSGVPAKGSNGFAIGNELKISGDHSVTLLGDSNNVDLGRVGILNTVFADPRPTSGYKIEYSAFENGKVKFVPDFNQATGNGTKLIVDAIDLGLDPKGIYGPVDLLSDDFRIVWKASLSAVGEWVLSLSVTNLDTAASWQYAGSPLTLSYPTNQNAYVAFQKANAVVGQLFTTTHLKFEYFDLPEDLDILNPPENFGVRPADGRNIIEWDANTQAGFKTYRISRSLDVNGPFDVIASTTETRIIDLNVINGVSYFYKAETVNIADQVSAPTAVLEGMPDASLQPPPNFLFIIADDMDTYAVNAYRRSEPVELDANGNFYAIDTPNLDRLADEGMMLHQARLMGANLPAVCTPSRTMIMSGKNTWQSTADVTAATTLPGIFNRGARSGQANLRHATYRTCKQGNSYPTANAEFDVVNDASKRGNTDGNGSEWHADFGIDYIADWNDNHRDYQTPFLIYLGFSHPHDERLAREDPDLTGRYGCVNTTNPAGIVLNTNAPPLPVNHLSCTPETYPAHPFDHGHLDVRDELLVAGMEAYRTEAVVRNEIGRNFACVDWIDQQIGRVLERLEDPDGDGNTADSVLDNTYIVFTSDHGMAIGRHGLQGKQNLYEHTWRVPYIVRGPNIDPGTESDALIYLHDSFPTLADLAGLDLPPTMDENDGVSFKEVLEGTSAFHRDVLYGVYAGGDKPGIRAVTDGRFKLIKYDVGDNATQVTQLFDLYDNPFELLPEHGVPNLAEEPAFTLVRQYLEEKLTEQRTFNADPYDFLGDRTLLRFEEGVDGQEAGTLEDRFALANNFQAFSDIWGSVPAYSTDVPDSSDFVLGEVNSLSLDFEQDEATLLYNLDPVGFDFGNAPFTIEAWVKLETMPVGTNLASTLPVVMKGPIGAGITDISLDYMFLASAGVYGDSNTYSNLALHLGSNVVVSTLAIPDMQWHHITAALDPVADIARFTLDGQTEIIGTAAHGTINDGPLIIGAHFDVMGWVDCSFDGLIDELSITAGFLSDGELQPLLDIPPPVASTLYPPTVSNGVLSVSFDSDSSFLYDLESKERLTDPQWIVEQTYLWGPDSSITVDIDANGSETSRFYRVHTKEPQHP